MYALFEGNRQIWNPFPTEKEVWEAALIDGLVTDVTYFPRATNIG
jgi:hypothetical protein